MKTIDYHVHLGHDSQRFGFRLSDEELLRDMNKWNISQSVVFSCPNVDPSDINPYEIDNNYILEVSKRNDRLIPFMFVHPYRDSLKMLELNHECFRFL